MLDTAITWPKVRCKANSSFLSETGKDDGGCSKKLKNHIHTPWSDDSLVSNCFHEAVVTVDNSYLYIYLFFLTRCSSSEGGRSTRKGATKREQKLKERELELQEKEKELKGQEEEHRGKAEVGQKEVISP